MPTRIQVLPGERYGSWTLIEELSAVSYSTSTQRRFKARCDCGAFKHVRLGDLKSGKSKCCRSCSMTKHNKSKSPEYVIWSSMLQRCNNPANSNYSNYGGRGVYVCDRWDPSKGGSFDNFLADMGNRPSPDSQLDKEANALASKEYGPSTVRWVTAKENLNRTRRNVFVTLNNKTHTLSQWSELLGMPYATVCGRIHRGWPPERALTTPVDPRYRTRK